MGRFQSKECFYTFKYTFFFFFGLLLLLFFSKIFIFLSFSFFFFDEVSNLRNIIFNQSETGIVDKKFVSDTVYAK